MYLRPTYVRKNGRQYAYWKLVESYRIERGPRQRTVAYLGQMDEAGRLGVEQAADPQPASRQQQLFPEVEAESRYSDIGSLRAAFWSATPRAGSTAIACSVTVRTAQPAL